jgi:hypothetical protein
MFSDVVFRFRALFRRKAIESELDEELHAHVLRETEKHTRAGVPREIRWSRCVMSDARS